MTFDLQKIVESKRAMRRSRAARPVAEKLRMLDQLRERTLAIRHAAQSLQDATVLREESPTYGKSEKPA